MQVTVTMADADAAVVQQQVTDVAAAVQALVANWVRQVVQAVLVQEGEALRDLWSRLPVAVQSQVRALVEPYREPEPQYTEPPIMVPE